MSSGLKQPEELGGASYAGTAESKRPPETRRMAGSDDGPPDQSKVISASSSLDKPSPRRADFQRFITDRFLDLDTDRPAQRTRCLKADQDGRVIGEDVRTDHAVSTWGQKGPDSRTFRGGSLGAGIKRSTLWVGKKKTEHTKRGAEGVWWVWTRGVAHSTRPEQLRRSTTGKNT